MFETSWWLMTGVRLASDERFASVAHCAAARSPPHTCHTFIECSGRRRFGALLSFSMFSAHAWTVLIPVIKHHQTLLP